AHGLYRGCDNRGFLVNGAADAGIEEITGLDGQVLAAQHIADQMVGIPYTAPVRRVQVLRPDVSLSVYPGRDGCLQRGLVFLLLFSLHLEKTPYQRRSGS